MSKSVPLLLLLLLSGSRYPSAQRTLSEGKDSRFDEIKTQPARFFSFWVGQATWVALVGTPVWLSNALPASSTRPWGRWGTAITALVALSWGVEILADRQKSAWRKGLKEGRHHEKFVHGGLWGLTRHPK